MVNLHSLTASGNKKSKRLGRGNASRGNYSGRGMKGQKARSGVGGLKKKGVKQWLMKVPKSRGFKSPHLPQETVSLADLEKNFSAKENITPFILRKKGLIKNYKAGVKILANGRLSKPLQVKVHSASKAAAAAIAKAGGKLELMEKSKSNTKKEKNKKSKK